MDLPYLASAFHDGSVLPAGDATVTARTLAIGTLSLPNGQLVVADAFAAPDSAALAQRLPAGAYPVVLSLITYPDSQYETVAAALLRVAPGEPITWRLATTPGQDLNALAADETYGYPVDSGTAMFASPASARQFEQRMARFGGIDFAYLKEVSQTMLDNAPNGGGWANLTLDAKAGTNVVVFQSGFGDGFYASYWGYDTGGTLVCLVTDFDLIFSDDVTPP